MSLEEQEKVKASFKGPLDFKTINCICGRTQWILSAKNLRTLTIVEEIEVDSDGKRKNSSAKKSL
jgi:hypothetical protein